MTCTCLTPGFCERHGVKKSAHWHCLCQQGGVYFQAWEEGRGPGQIVPVATKPEKAGPGSFLRRMLGCSWKKWPHFATMDALGAECDVEKFSDMLSETGKIGAAEATRLIQMAIAKYKETRT
jgi:hypothetical protein